MTWDKKTELSRNFRLQSHRPKFQFSLFKRQFKMFVKGNIVTYCNFWKNNRGNFINNEQNLEVFL